MLTVWQAGIQLGYGIPCVVLYVLVLATFLKPSSKISFKSSFFNISIVLGFVVGILENKVKFLRNVVSGFIELRADMGLVEGSILHLDISFLHRIWELFSSPHRFLPQLLPCRNSILFANYKFAESGHRCRNSFKAWKGKMEWKWYPHWWQLFWGFPKDVESLMVLLIVMQGY